MRGSCALFLMLCASLVDGNACPNGYTQQPGGDCFQSRNFYDDFIGQYTPTTFDQAEGWCNMEGGGLLASIRNEEENEMVWNLPWGKGKADIGLKCKGLACKWDDGAPVTYTNFKEGKGPIDDSTTRCYMMDQSPPHASWQERGCGKQQGDTYICRVKARTIECDEGETEYAGGCVSVHSSPLDQKSAQASCPGGGHLVSIHSGTENNVYKQIALDAGVNGTIYIGGQFSNGVFEWIDGSYYLINGFANGFPNTVFGTCVQMLLASEFGVLGQWTNIDCTTKQPYMCFRDGANYGNTTTIPKAEYRCPSVQYYTGSGTIYSPNYPLSIPGQQSCEYVIGTNETTRATVKFSSYDCQSGTSLTLFDGLNSDQPFLSFTSTSPSTNQSYSVTSNVMKMVFSADSTSPSGTGWEAEFTGI